MNQSASSARILVFDNDRSCAHRLRTILRSAGYTGVSSVLNARNARQECRRVRPRLLILDPCVEGGSGYELAESFLEGEEPSAIPQVLFVTADTSEGPRIQAGLLRAAAVLEKPCPEDDLLRHVRMALLG